MMPWGGLLLNRQVNDFSFVQTSEAFFPEYLIFLENLEYAEYTICIKTHMDSFDSLDNWI